MAPRLLIFTTFLFLSVIAIFFICFIDSHKWSEGVLTLTSADQGTEDHIGAEPRVSQLKHDHTSMASMNPIQGCYMLFNLSGPTCPLRNRTFSPLATYRPDYFILGTRKGGTTSLATYISKHKLVFPVNIHGQPTDGEVFTSMRLAKKYNRVFMKARAYQFVGDSNVARLINDPIYLAKNGNFSRFLVLLRDPIARCLSQCMMRLRLAPKRYKYLKSGLESYLLDEKEKLLNSMDSYSKSDYNNSKSFRPLFRSSRNCWYEGLYILHLRRLLEYIPPASLRIYWSQDFFNHPKEVVLDALKFIGANPDDWDPVSVETVYNSAGSQGLPKPSSELVNEMRAFYRPFDEALSSLLGSPVPWQNENLLM